MFTLEEKITVDYIVTTPQGEVTFKKKDEAITYLKLSQLAQQLTSEQVENAVKRTPEQVAAWSAIGSCPNCGGNQGNGDLDIEHLDGDCYAAECYVCGTRFDIIEGKSEVIY